MRSCLMFQSLLWWIGRVNTRSHRPVAVLAMFQSLLWWIGRVNLTRSASAGRTWRMFQSLLWWIGRVNIAQVGSFTTCRGVSILVVVDWSRQHPSTVAGRHW